MTAAVPRFWRRWRKWLLGTIFVLVVLYVLRVPLFGSLVAQIIAARLADSIGGTVSIDHVSGSWWSDITIHDLKITKAADGSLPLASISELSISYGTSLFFGNMDAINRITARDVDIIYDARIPTASGNTDLQTTFTMISGLVRDVDLQGRFTVLLPNDHQLQLSGIAIVGDTKRIALDVGALQFDGEQLDPFACVLLRPNATSCHLANPFSLAGVRIEHAQCDWTSTLQTKLRMGLDAGSVNVVATQTMVDVDIAAIDLNLLLHRFAFVARMPWENVNGKWYGTLKAEHTPDGWTLAGTQRVDGLTLNEVGPFALHGTFLRDASGLRIEQAHLNGPEQGHITLTDLAFTDQMRPHTGTITIAIPHAEAWWSDLTPVIGTTGIDATLTISSVETPTDERVMLHLTTATLTTSKRALQLVKPVTITIAPDLIEIPRLSVTSPNGLIEFAGTFVPGGGSLSLQSDQFALNELGYPDVSGHLALAVTAQGPWTTPRLAITCDTTNLRLMGHDMVAHLQLQQDDSGITSTKSIVSVKDIGQVEIDGKAPISVGSHGITLATATTSTAVIRGELTKLGDLLPAWFTNGVVAFTCTPRGGDDLWAAEIEVRADNVVLRDHTQTAAGQVPTAPNPIAGLVNIATSHTGITATMAISQAQNRLVHGDIALRGNMADLATAQHSWHTMPVTGSLQVERFPLAPLTTVFPAILNLGGTLDGSLAVTGTASQPRWNGTLNGTAITCKISNIIPTMSDGQAAIAIKDTTLQLERTSFQMGGEPVDVGGTITIAEDPRCDLHITGKNALLVQRHDVRIRSDLDLTLTGRLSALQLQGSAQVTNAVINPDLSLWQIGGGAATSTQFEPFSLDAPLLAPMTFDVRVTNQVQSEEDGIRIVTKLVRALCDLDLRLGGTGAEPLLTGRIIARRGKVILPFSTLQLEQGEINFPITDPFSPKITAQAHAQVRRYTVQLGVSGPLLDPQIIASADGLDQRDAMLLLTTGATSSELTDEAGQRATLNRVGGWLGMEAFHLIDGPEDTDAGPGLLDRVRIDIGRQLSDSGNNTIQAEVEITDPEGNPGLFMYGERDRWDDYNAGVILRFSWGGEE